MQNIVQEFEKWLQSSTDLQKDKLSFDLYAENNDSEDCFKRRIKWQCGKAFAFLFLFVCYILL